MKNLIYDCVINGIESGDMLHYQNLKKAMKISSSLLKNQRSASLTTTRIALATKQNSCGGVYLHHASVWHRGA